MTAADAREESERGEQAALEEDYRRVQRMIQEQAGQGQTYCRPRFMRVGPKLRAILVAEGYRVNFWGSVVSWGKK